VRNFVIKALVYLAMLVLLWIGIGLVSGIVNDRLRHKDAAQNSISQSHAGSQLLAGPVLVVQTTETWVETQMTGEGKNRKQERTEKQVNARHIVLPESLDITGDVQIEPKRRGIFSVNTYGSTVELRGTWRVPQAAALPKEHAGNLVLQDAATAFISVSHARGLQTVAFQVDGQALEIAPDTERSGGLPSARAVLNIKALAGRDVPFVARVSLTGTESISFLPLGKQNTVSISSNWPTPAFEGANWPVQKNLGPAGFDAKWQISSLASEARAYWSAAITANPAPGAAESAAPNGRIATTHAISVRMVDRLDVYTFTDRATKYGILFITLTLAGYALFEVFKHIRVHPIQTLLVGAALVLFFLLLLSLSEQIGFALAYLAATASCVGLIGYYSGYVLGGFLRSLPLTLGLASLYGALYLMLHSEDNALLIGSVMLFGMLAAIMVATRKVNWYALLDQGQPAQASKAAKEVLA
jgi:inner membrane protein